MGEGAIAIIGLFLSAAGTGASIANAEQAKSQAKKQRAVQQRQAALQARQKQIESQRAARIQRARLVASSIAQGGESSTVESGLIAGQTQANTQVGFIQDANTLQQQQIDLSIDQTIGAINGQIGQSLGNFAATALTPTGTDNQSLVQRAFGE